MSFPVKFFWLQKKVNSTKIPTNAQLEAGQTFNCTLLDNTSVMNPTFKISIAPDVNIWNEQWEVGGIAWVTGKNSSETDRIRSVDYIPALPSTQYYFSYASDTRFVWFYDINKNLIPNVNGSNNFLQLNNNVHLFTTPANCYYMRFIVWTTYGTTYRKNISINSPITITNYQPYSSLITYNYCFVPEFERFYFINDISTDKNFWYVSCTCDVLATYRDTILSGSHYVLRSASQRDEYILDTAYISKVKESGTFVPITDPFAYTNGHSYVWCIAGDVIGSQTNNEQIGSNVYYWMNDAESQTFVNYLMDVQHYGIQTAEYSEAVQKALVNPMQYINSVILLPFDKNAALTTNNHVKFGYYDIEVSGGSVKRLTQGTMIHTDTLTVNIPKHPQAASRGKYMNNAPYTAYELYFGAFGTIPLDPASLIDENTLTITIRTECATGVSQLFVRGTATDVMIYAGTAQVGVPVTVSQLTRDMLGEIQNNLNMQFTAAGGALQIAGAAMNPSSALGAAGGVLGTVMNYGSMAFDAVRLQYPTLSGGGANGSFMSMHSTSYLNAKFYECVGTNNTELGRPLYQTKTLSTLSGFTVCQGADVEIGAMAAESEQINAMLNSGFFIE